MDPTQLWIEAQKIRGSLIRKPKPSALLSPPDPPVPSLPAAERDLATLLAQVGGARERLLPLLEEEDLTHPGLRILLAAMKASPAVPPEALMADLPGDRERGLLAALLMAEQSWRDHEELIAEYARRIEIRHRLRQIHLVTQAIVQAQAAGDPVATQLEAELRTLQEQAREVRGLAVARTRGDARSLPHGA